LHSIGQTGISILVEQQKKTKIDKCEREIERE